MGVRKWVSDSVAMVPIVLPNANDSPFADERRARPSRIRRASATAAALALLMLAFATPAQAASVSPVVLTVENQGGSAFLEWEFASVGVGTPSVEYWVLTKIADDGQSIDILLPAGASSYTDSDVESGRTYAYTVSYVENGLRMLPSNPVVFSRQCWFIFKCDPFQQNFPLGWLGCLVIC